MNYGSADMTSGQGNFKKVFKIQGGDRGVQTHNIFRIYPPMLDQALTGRWSAWEATHWGYFGASRNDPTKAFPRSFLCPLKKDFRTGRIDVPCAECELIERLAAERKQLDPGEGKDKKGRNLSHLSSGQKERLNFLELFLDGGEQGAGRHERRLKVRLNVFSKKDGAAGLLLVSSHLFYQIKAKNEKEAVTNPGIIDKYMKLGYNALDPRQGLWFDIVRTGNGSGRGDGNAKDFVVELQEADPANPLQKRVVPAPIEKGGVIDKAAEQCRDILDDSHTSRPTPEQIEALVALWESGENSPENVDMILDDAPQQPKRGPAVAVPQNFRPTAAEDEEKAFATPPASAPAPTPTPAPAAKPQPVAVPAAVPAPPATPPATPAEGAPKDQSARVAAFLAEMKAKAAANKTAQGQGK